MIVIGHMGSNISKTLFIAVSWSGTVIPGGAFLNKCLMKAASIVLQRSVVYIVCSLAEPWTFSKLGGF
jgi:hypothetical protein